MASERIELRGVTVHNLKGVNLDIPHQQLVVFCGVSGSGKTSLALDTLYAEGQRRYIESFSAYTRQFLARLPKPAADQINGIPPAIAVTHKNTSGSSRATVGTATEVFDYLRLLFARVANIHCPKCHRELRRDTAESIAADLAGLHTGTRFLVTVPCSSEPNQNLAALAQTLQEEGYVRWIVGNTITSLESAVSGREYSSGDEPAGSIDIVVDRLTAGQSSPSRLRESVETAMAKADGCCQIFIPEDAWPHLTTFGAAGFHAPTQRINDQLWKRLRFSRRLACEDCEFEYPRLEPRLFSFNSPLGACPECEGFGNVMDIDLDLVVPDRNKSLADGAIAPWNTPAYRHELDELLELADDYGIPVDVPFRDLEPAHLQLIQKGIPERGFGGLDGFFRWLERRKYKMHIRVFLSRWRSYRVCESCHGDRLRLESLSARLQDKSIAEICRLPIREAQVFFNELQLTEYQLTIGRTMLDQIRARLGFLHDVRLQYLSLDRPLRTLSGGEAQRIALTAAFGSSLVNMLYVLDEPSKGLHPQDIGRLVEAIGGLRDRGNTVVVVEHEEAMIRMADRVIEFGPGAGEDGGHVTFEGTVDELCEQDGILTGDYLSGRRGGVVPVSRRPPTHGSIRLKGARGNNLQNIDVVFPLGILCLVTGVSGAGKSTLVERTLYPALCRRKGKEAPKPCPYDEVIGDGQLDDVLLIDQSPIGRSPRSIPVTYIKAFDAIRNVFAETLEARTRNYKASHFSFNVDGGRCDACKGDGTLQIDMQFLADVMMTCNECHGRRYRREILDITYRGRNIAEVLEMTIRQAYGFFRGQVKVQSRLQRLIEVGLDYVRLGQAANTLSAGEAQRLKLAAYLSAPCRGRTLFLLDEPTTGLHFSDVVQLLDCFEALISVGHSLVVVEHNQQLMQSADYLIDLGPGASDEGGRVVTQGTPEEVARCQESATGRVLAEMLHPANV